VIGRRHAYYHATSLAAAVLVVAGCGAATPGPAAPGTVGTEPAAVTRSTMPVPAAPAPTQIVRLSFSGGQAGGAPDRIPVTLGATVEMIVTSDVADEVHLHGYDRSVTVPAGGTVMLSFTAAIPGVFEVELEELGEPLGRLEVS
jgi:hypothetical protein